MTNIDPVKLTQDLIACETVTADANPAAINLLNKILSNMGFTVEQTIDEGPKGAYPRSQPLCRDW